MFHDLVTAVSQVWRHSVTALGHNRGHLMCRYAAIALLLTASSLAAEELPCSALFSDLNGDYVVDNPGVNQGLSGASVKWAFTSTYAANWHPLTWLSYLTEITLFGLNPAAFHITNVLIHIASGVILFFLLFRMTGDRGPSATLGLGARSGDGVEAMAGYAVRVRTLGGAL